MLLFFHTDTVGLGFKLAQGGGARETRSVKNNKTIVYFLIINYRILTLIVFFEIMIFGVFLGGMIFAQVS